MRRVAQTFLLIAALSATDRVAPCGAQSSYALDKPRLIGSGDSMFVQIGEHGRWWHRVVQPSGVRYRSADPTILTIRPNGLVIARRPGWVEVEASWSGGHFTNKVLVLEPITQVQITPRDTVLHVGDSVLVRTIAHDSSGAELSIPLAWGYTAGPEPSAFRMFRTVFPSGLWIVAEAVGQGRIWTELGPRVDTARIRVIE
jgi:hypothetical protein